MDKAKKSQMLKLFLIAAVLFITPLLSSSLGTTYLYFIIINLLIIALGAEAGLLSFSKPPQDKKYAVPVSAKPLTHPDQAVPDKEASSNSTNTGVLLTTPEGTEKKAKVVEKSASEKIVGAAKLSKVRKCPSTPSLFFIGGGEAEAEEAVGEEDQEEVGGLSGQELFTKAETFIGNFHKQLKMQREESWKRLHEFYQKAF
ncbi:hypothetical protein PVL29_025716 [Vitis rotundifolia]|uniref:DUF4408 domain-containing protein n=1 Tax=Vitis rotundifolia TaxID=103349 RepID=A0AA39D5T7_VITRO|nr:hypothetical protein PVL29_025716 [Vitis rotundifolia]